MANFDYETKISNKARRIRITIYPQGRVVVTRPKNFPESLAEKFVQSKSGWIQKKLDYYKNRKVQTLGTIRSKTKQEALEFVKSRIEIYNSHYRFDVGKVSIKDIRSLWGSCSRRKNLNFNHKIVELPQEQADYIIVHELCHLGEFNHSKRFWELVAQTIPNFQVLKKELKIYSFQ